MSIPRGLNDQLKNPLVTLRNDLIALRSVFAGMLLASVTNDFASLVDGAGASLDVVVPGAALGDFAFVSLGVDVQGITCSAHVKSTDIVTVRLQNETAGTIDLASTTVKVGVMPVHKAQVFGLIGSTTWDPASLVDGAGESADVTVTGAALGDFAVAALLVDTGGMCISASVKSANTVTVRLQNETTGTLDLASTRVRVLVIPAALIRVGAVTNNFASLADAAGASLDVSAPTAKLGDFVLPSLGLDAQGQLVTAAVKSNGIATVRLQNESGGTLDLASTTVSVGVIPSSWLVTPPALTTTIQ